MLTSNIALAGDQMLPVPVPVLTINNTNNDAWVTVYKEGFENVCGWGMLPANGEW